MRGKSALLAASAMAATIALATTLAAQEFGPGKPWRGAGSQPCFGPDEGAINCVPAPGVVAVRAGHLFDSKSGRMLSNQLIVLSGDRISDVGPESQVKVPAGAQVIDLSQATVLPGLIDAHTHMFNPPKPGMSRETSTLIAIQHVQADLRAGFTAARDMSSHGNGYADVDIRNAINRGPHRGTALQGFRPRHRVDRRCISGGESEPAGDLCGDARSRMRARRCASMSSMASTGSSCSRPARIRSPRTVKPSTSSPIRCRSCRR